jgi:putative SOS response-associated peptidase YedK
LNVLRTINAKAETITTALSFREAIKYRHCLVPADALYEWQKLDAKTKRRSHYNESGQP